MGVTLKIIMGEHSEVRTQHARTVHESIAQNEKRNPMYAKPMGVASHLARFPVTCDECGETFWAADLYATHAKCKRSEQRIGF